MIWRGRTVAAMIAAIVATMPAAGAAIAPMFPPGAASAPIVQILAAQRIAVVVAVEHPQAIAGVIEIIVPAAAEPDLDETGAIIPRIIAVVAIAIVISIGVIFIIIASARPRRCIAGAIDVAIIATAEAGRRQRAERDRKGTAKSLGHGPVLIWSATGGDASWTPDCMSRVEFAVNGAATSGFCPPIRKSDPCPDRAAPRAGPAILTSTP